MSIEWVNISPLPSKAVTHTKFLHLKKKKKAKPKALLRTAHTHYSPHSPRAQRPSEHSYNSPDVFSTHSHICSLPVARHTSIWWLLPPRDCCLDEGGRGDSQVTKQSTSSCRGHNTQVCENLCEGHGCNTADCDAHDPLHLWGRWDVFLWQRMSTYI